MTTARSPAPGDPQAPPAEPRDAVGRGEAHPVRVHPTRERDFAGIEALCERVYPRHVPYTEDDLSSHLAVFPQGQLTAVEVLAEGGDDEPEEERVVGMAASLVVSWDDYEPDLRWRDYTAHGTFTNHDPAGRTLYGAEVMVDPDLQGRGVGSRLYRERDALLLRLGLRRIRAHSRLRGYGPHAGRLTAEEYVVRVVRGELADPTLSFQLHRGFRVMEVVSGYLVDDPESMGFAALIERLNPEIATPEDYAKGDPRFRAPE